MKLISQCYDSLILLPTNIFIRLKMGTSTCICCGDQDQYLKDQNIEDKRKAFGDKNQKNIQTHKQIDEKERVRSKINIVQKEQISLQANNNLSKELQLINLQIQRCQNINQKIELMIQKANILEKEQNYNQMLTVLKELANDSTNLDESTLGYIYFRIANIYAINDSLALQDSKNIKYYLNKAMSIYEKRKDVFQQEIVTLKNSLGFCYEKFNQWKQAEAQYQQAYQLGRKVYGQQDSRTIVILNNLASSYFNNDKKDQWHEAIQKCRKWSKGKDVSKLIQDNYIYYSDKQKELKKEKEKKKI